MNSEPLIIKSCRGVSIISGGFLLGYESLGRVGAIVGLIFGLAIFIVGEEYSYDKKT